MVRAALCLLVSGCFFAPPRPEFRDGGDTGGDGGDDGGLPINTSLAFVSSSTTDFGGGVDVVMKANALCNMDALGAPTGPFVAWIAGSTSALGSSGGWYRYDGQPFASSTGDIQNGRIFAPLRLDEHGHDVEVEVATGTMANGVGQAGLDCTNGATNILLGHSDAGTKEWTEGTSSAFCTSDLHVYCFETDHPSHVTSTPPIQGQRVVFITDVHTLNPTGDTIDTLTSFCMQQRGPLTGSFIPLVATQLASAKDRVTTQGPWYRPDGVLAIDAEWNQTAPIDVTAQGNYVFDSLDDNVWTGALSFTVVSDYVTACNDWTSGSSSVNGLDGNFMRSNSTGFYAGLHSCDSPLRIYCIQNN